jgi:phosphopantetheine adenylyltransferase
MDDLCEFYDQQIRTQNSTMKMFNFVHVLSMKEKEKGRKFSLEEKMALYEQMYGNQK